MKKYTFRYKLVKDKKIYVGEYIHLDNFKGSFTYEIVDNCTYIQYKNKLIALDGIECDGIIFGLGVFYYKDQKIIDNNLIFEPIYNLEKINEK